MNSKLFTQTTKVYYKIIFPHFSSYMILKTVSFSANCRFCSHGLVGTRQVQLTDLKES